MKLGFFTMPMHPPGRDYTQTLKEDREAVLLADRLGYCEAFIGERPEAVRDPGREAGLIRPELDRAGAELGVFDREVR